MAIGAADIVELYTSRKAEAGPWIAAAREVISTYNGDLAIPLAELDETERKAVPNLLNQGLNQTAMRIASTQPDVFFPAERPGFKESERNARIRRQATLGWWEHSSMKLMLRRRARYLVGFASAPVELVPDFDNGVPRWELRHPLNTFPARTTNPDDVDPDDCIMVATRTLGWLQRQNPDVYLRLAKGQNPTPDQTFEILRYVDGDVVVMVALGETYDPGRPANGSERFVELSRVRNRAGVCTAVVPGRITLDRPQGAYDGMVGLYQQQAALMALEYIAVKKGIFSDEWLVARPNEQPSIVQMADGLRGVLGIVRGGDIKSTQQQPGYKTDQMLNTLERGQRLEGGIPAEYGGESTTNVRTGRRGDAILSAVVDFPVQEAQQVLEVALETENKVAVAIAKGNFGKERKSFYVGFRGAKGVVNYTPDIHFTSDTNTVTYAYAGADVNNLIIGLGQMIGVKMISTELAREMNPMIDDPEREHARVIVESLENALLASVQQHAEQGQMAPSDLARVMDLVATERKDLTAAVIQVQQEAQTRQATAGPVGTPAGPVAPGAPEAQPGIAAPGSSAPAGSIAPTPNEQGLSQLLGALKGGAAA